MAAQGGTEIGGLEEQGEKEEEGEEEGEEEEQEEEEEKREIDFKSGNAWGGDDVRV